MTTLKSILDKLLLPYMPLVPHTEGHRRYIKLAEERRDEAIADIKKLILKKIGEDTYEQGDYGSGYNQRGAEMRKAVEGL